MDLCLYCEIIVEPILSNLVNLYSKSGISFEDAQSIGASFECILGCLEIKTDGYHLVEKLVDEFCFNLEKARARKVKGDVNERKKI